MRKYNQIKAMLAITKASLKAMLRNPSSIFFSILFPVIFIAIFGLFGNNLSKYIIYVDPGTNTSDPIYMVIEKIQSFEKKSYTNYDKAYEDLKIGRLDAILKVTTVNGKSNIELTTSEASAVNGSIINSILEGVVNQINISSNKIVEIAKLQTNQISGREYKEIDFILPGQIGFALLNSGIFGTAFVLLSLKETLVLKRFFATPINRMYILIAEGLSRLIFSSLQAILIITVGYFFFHFTLIHGIWTAIEMVILSSLGLIVFLGMGLLISSIAKDENSISPIANLFTLPQFLLGGVFFPIDVFPDWLQPFAKVLPLTHLNEAMRAIAFEGASFQSEAIHIVILLIWAIVIYTITAKLFKWDK